MDEFSLVDHAVRTQLGLQRLGVLCGLVVALAGLIATVALAYLGHGVAAGVVGTVDLVALVSVFVVGRRTQVKVEEARAKAMAPVESESEAEAEAKPQPQPKAIAGTKAGKKGRR